MHALKTGLPESIEVMGCDVDPTVTKVAGKRYPDINSDVAEMYSLSMEEDLDFLYSNETFHWAPKLPEKYHNVSGCIYPFFPKGEDGITVFWYFKNSARGPLMESIGENPAPTLRAAWRMRAQTHPWTAFGLATAAIAMLWLLVASGWHVYKGEADAAVRLAFLGGMAAFAATASGALPGIALRGLSQRLEDSMLGFAAGMMLAASSFSLILPGLEAAETISGSAGWGSVTVVAGMALGVLLMLGLDQFTPHEHVHGGPCGAGCERLSRLWLFVLAITLHNFPEGMAIGVSFSQGDLSVGVPLTSAIAIQDIPEGLAVAMALRAIGLTPVRAALLAAATGLMEPLGALLGIGLTSGLALAYPIGLGLAAGAMIFVVSHEVIPETHRNGHQTPATLGLMGGFALMMVLDTALG